MADIGLSGSGFGIASLVLQVGDSIMRLKGFWDAVEDAPEEIKHLIEEIEILSLVLSDFETPHLNQPEPEIGNEARAKCVQFFRKAVIILEAVVKEAEVEIRKRRKLGSMKAVLKKAEIAKLRERLATAQSMLMLSNNLYLVDLQKRNRQAHHDWAHSHQQELRELRVIVSQSTETILSSTSFQRSCQPNLAAVEPSSPQIQSNSLNMTEENHHFRKCKSHSKPELRIKARFKTPKWLFGVSRAIEIYESHANAGWNFHIQVYNVVPSDSPQFKMVRIGDAVGIQQLFSTGKASPYDRSPSGMTLLDMAAIRQNLDVCRLLKNEGADPACWCLEDHTDPNAVNDVIRLLAQDLELLDSCEETSREEDWVSFRCNVETFAWLLKASNSTHQNRSLEQCVLFALKICSPRARSMSRLVRMIIDGREINRHMCGIQERGTNMTLLHFTARNLGLYFSSKYYARGSLLEDVQHLCALIRDLIRGGSDMHAITWLNFTPLLEVLTNHISEWSKYMETLRLYPENNNPTYIWLKELHNSGLDLEQYGREEKRRLFSRRVSREWVCYEFNYREKVRPRCRLRLLNLTYGPEPSDWVFWIVPVMEPYFAEFWDMVDHPERAMPGAWEDGYIYDDWHYYERHFYYDNSYDD
ncbi:hypothetical protein N431DRAFT_418216 [Stipitochalara longipes BDJ]|nr:hypothetical protein N431DRAFT_418216 [Stipitochalara longipes BDJ]